MWNIISCQHCCHLYIHFPVSTTAIFTYIFALIHSTLCHIPGTHALYIIIYIKATLKMAALLPSLHTFSCQHCCHLYIHFRFNLFNPLPHPRHSCFIYIIYIKATWPLNIISVTFEGCFASQKTVNIYILYIYMKHECLGYGKGLNGLKLNTWVAGTFSNFTHGRLV